MNPQQYITHSNQIAISSQSTTWSQALTVPFGETFVNQTSTFWETHYTFYGKEKDGELGIAILNGKINYSPLPFNQK